MINEQSLDVFGDNRVLEYDGETAYTSSAISIGFKESDKPARWSKIALELNGSVTTDGTLVVTIKDNTPEATDDETPVVTSYVFTFASAKSALDVRDGNPVLRLPLPSHISGKIKVGISGTCVANLYGNIKVYGG